MICLHRTASININNSFNITPINSNSSKNIVICKIMVYLYISIKYFNKGVFHMALKSVIRKGDTTTHGGTVIEGIEDYLVYDKPIACKTHRVLCPLCKGTFPIVEGVESVPIQGKPVAVEGMKTACGAKLIASQTEYQIE